MARTEVPADVRAQDHATLEAAGALGSVPGTDADPVAAARGWPEQVGVASYVPTAIARPVIPPAGPGLDGEIRSAASGSATEDGTTMDGRAAARSSVALADAVPTSSADGSGSVATASSSVEVPPSARHGTALADGAPPSDLRRVDGAVDSRPGCTAAQLRRFIKSRAWIPMHELRRRFTINGADDEVMPVDVQGRQVFVGLPEREARMLGDLLRSGEVGYELSLDPSAPIVIGVYPMRPVTRG